MLSKIDELTAKRQLEYNLDKLDNGTMDCIQFLEFAEQMPYGIDAGALISVIADDVKEGIL